MGIVADRRDELLGDRLRRAIGRDAPTLLLAFRHELADPLLPRVRPVEDVRRRLLRQDRAPRALLFPHVAPDDGDVRRELDVLAVAPRELLEPDLRPVLFAREDEPLPGALEAELAERRRDLLLDHHPECLLRGHRASLAACFRCSRAISCSSARTRAPPRTTASPPTSKASTR